MSPPQPRATPSRHPRKSLICTLFQTTLSRCTPSDWSIFCFCFSRLFISLFSASFLSISLFSRLFPFNFPPHCLSFLSLSLFPHPCHSVVEDHDDQIGGKPLDSSSPFSTNHNEDDDDDGWRDAGYHLWPAMRSADPHLVDHVANRRTRDPNGDPLEGVPIDHVYHFWCLAGGDVQAVVAKAKGKSVEYVIYRC